MNNNKLKDWELMKAFEEGAPIRRTSVRGKVNCYNKQTYCEQSFKHQFDFTSFRYELALLKNEEVEVNWGKVPAGTPLVCYKDGSAKKHYRFYLALLSLANQPLSHASMCLNSPSTEELFVNTKINWETKNMWLPYFIEEFARPEALKEGETVLLETALKENCVPRSMGENSDIFELKYTLIPYNSRYWKVENSSHQILRYMILS